MTRTCIGLSLVLLIGGPGLGTAQEPTQTPLTRSGIEERKSNQAAVQPSAAAASPNAMYEDIEIMRRLLSRELQVHGQAWCSSCHVPSVRGFGFSGEDKTAAWKFFAGGMPGAWAHLTQGVGVDGTYLKGYGVVFHVTMPWLAGAQTKPAAAAPTAVSDWERVRKELRGDKTAKTDAPPLKVMDEVDVLVKLLADNGRNFSKLGATENLTIVVNLQPAGDPHASHGILLAERVAHGSGASALGKTKAAGDTVQGSSGVGDFELLGDLQIKQGRVQEAIQAYQKAVEAQADRKWKAAIYQKLAQAHLKLDEKSTAGAIAKAIDYLNLAQRLAGAATAEPPPPKLPKRVASKLILTAPKSLLDAAAKVITFEEFHKGVHVERIAIPDSDRQGETKGASYDTSGSAGS